MPKTWLVVADSGSARIFRIDSSSMPLEEIETLAHPEARVREQALTSDRPGRVFDSRGEGRHAYGKEVGPAEHEAIGFAHQVAERMRDARARGVIDRVVLVAAPAFLGHLRAALDDDTRRIVAAEFDLNLVHMKPSDIRAHLPEKLS